MGRTAENKDLQGLTIDSKQQHCGFFFPLPHPEWLLFQ
jgi:hypothetical protein